MSETIVEYNGHHVRLGSPLDARLRKQDENYRDAVEGDTLDLPLIEGGESASADTVNYKKLNVEELDALLAEREIDVPDDAKKADKVDLLETADADAEGDTLA